MQVVKRVTKTVSRVSWLALGLALCGPAIGLGGYWISVQGSETGILRRLVEPGLDHAVATGIEVFLGYELVIGLLLVTQAWAREKDLRRHNELMGAVIESVTEGVVVADTRGRFLVVNDAAKRLVGGYGRHDVDPDDWSGVYGLYLPGTNQRFPAADLPLARAIRGEQILETEVVVRNSRLADSRGVWASVTAAPIRDRRGDVLGGVAVFRDITEKKRAEELTQRLSSALEQTADCVFITNRDGTIEYVNPAFEATTGYSRGEAVGNTPRILKSDRQGPEYARALWASILRGEPYTATVINRRKNGCLFIAEQTITPMRDSRTGEVTHFVSVLRDLADRLKLQEQGHELSLAAAVQQRLFPGTPPRIEGYDIAGAFSPALATCGDYFDFIQLPGDRLVCAVADVSGHGMGPALIMAATRGYLRSLTRTSRSLSELVAELNTLLLDDLDERHFVTMLLTDLNTRTGDLSWANMGHPAGFVVDGRGSVRTVLDSTGRPLGMFPDAGCSRGRPTVIGAGETMVMLTDGVIEAESSGGRPHGAEAALAVVRDRLDRPASEIVRGVIEATHNHTGGATQEDDVTVVVVKRLAA